MHPRPFVRSSLAAALLALSGAAQADVALPPQGVVTLAASASAEVAQDFMSLTLSTHREAADARTVQQQLTQALDAALVEARKAARPGQLDVRTGAFTVSVRYNDKGTATGWAGSAELVLEGRDMAAIGHLAGRLTTLTVARVGYDLSRELRARSEGEVTAQAAALFQARAADCARLFGFAGYAIREISVTNADAPSFRPMAPMAMKAMAASPADAPLPLEPGRGLITVNVGGSIQLTR